MTQNVKQSNMRKMTSDAGPNRAGLFAHASSGGLLAKLVQGGDFQKLTIVR